MVPISVCLCVCVYTRALTRSDGSHWYVCEISVPSCSFSLDPSLLLFLTFSFQLLTLLISITLFSFSLTMSLSRHLPPFLSLSNSCPTITVSLHPPPPRSTSFHPRPGVWLFPSISHCLPSRLSLLTCPVSSPSSCHFQRLTLSFSVPYPAFCGQFYLLSSVSVFLLSPDSPSCLYGSSASHRFSYFVKATLHHSCFSQFLSPPYPRLPFSFTPRPNSSLFPIRPRGLGPLLPSSLPCVLVLLADPPSLRFPRAGCLARLSRPLRSPRCRMLCSLRSGSRLFRALSKHAHSAGLGERERGERERQRERGERQRETEKPRQEGRAGGRLWPSAV